MKHWITLNEPYAYAAIGYDMGIIPPAHHSATEPYIVAHNLLLSHATIVNLYKRKYQVTHQIFS